MFKVVGDEPIVHTASETLTSYAVRWFEIEDPVQAVNRSTNRSKFTTNALYLTAGTYYLEVDGNATTDSWKYPYNFKINVPLTSPTVDVENLKISVYPNPASEIVNVKLSDAAPSVSTLILTDLLGKTVLKQAITSVETELDISAIPLGIYFVSIYRENEVVAKSRIVINR